MKKSKLNLLYAFLLPIVLLLINLLIVKIMYPSNEIFSSNQILVADLASQYEALFSYLKDVLSGSASLFYSFSKNLGGSMMSSFLYYLSSPLNLVLIFSPKSHLMDMMTLLILVKIGLCGLFMYIYLSKHFQKKEYYLLVFSTFYALMGYNLVYYFNVMWLDVIFLTPLVMLGIDKIIKKESLGLYTFSLFLAIISNFYIAYMLCIFCIIYFIYQMVLKYKKKIDNKIILKKVGLFVLGSILAGLLSSFILVPGALGLSQMLRMDYNTSEFINDNPLKAFLIFISRLFVGNQTIDNILSKVTPNVYFGLLPLVLVIFYFFNKKISKKEKILTGIIYLIFFISFSFNFPNLIWHGFSYPNGYAYRFSFLFSFFSFLIACKSFIKLKEIDIDFKLVVGILLSVILIIVLYVIVIDTNLSIVIGLVISFFLIGIYIIILSVLNHKRSKGLFISLLIFLLIEIILHINTSVYLTAHLGYNYSYENYTNEVCPYIEKLKNDKKRIDSMFMLGTLGSLMCGNSGLSGALTTHNGNLYQFLYETGNTVTYSTILNELDNTPVIYTLLGLKYYIGTISLSTIPNNYYVTTDSFVYDDVNGNTDYYIYENDLALSIGYLIENKEVEFSKVNSFEYQNEIFKNMTGIEEDVLKPYEKVQKDTYNYSFNIDNSLPIYVALKYPIPENFRKFALITIEDMIYEIDSTDNGIFAIDNIYDGKKINVKVSLNDQVYKYFDVDDELLNLYYLDEEVFEKGIKELKKNQLDVEKMDKNEFSGSINVEKDNSMLFLSIPYEKGWTVLVDGKKVEYDKLYDTFTGINLNKGQHKIEMTFYPEGLDVGILLSKIGLVILMVYCITKKGRKNYENK